MKLSIRDKPFLKKIANSDLVSMDLKGTQNDPKEVAKILIVLINTILKNVKPHLQVSFRKKIKDKFTNLSIAEIASKKMPPGARIGNSITILKNLLNGQHPVLISEVMRLVLKYL